MSINSKNYELYRYTDLREWYERHVIEPTLASLEEFQERDIGWALPRILNLTVNVNKLNPMCVGCCIKRCLHYFNTNEKLEIHSEDCDRMNDCAIRLPSEDEKWLSFRNHCRKEHVPFIVYADLKCVLQKTETSSASSYSYQQHDSPVNKPEKTVKCGKVAKQHRFKKFLLFRIL
ncbi:hypothetical protein ALC62_15190 [Cyphomyrmex costatus]|uniref:Uncharacterized protein n=1 Tax=Cyphomyrmex costatus TaxID=456900 RepID=A0A151I7R8_9HYME|nr:hypothetical protein ALC62_15190 [Cyphomyrmex costatus]